MLKNDIDNICTLQDEIIFGLVDKEALRKNTREMFINFLEEPNLTLGIFDKNTSIAISIMVDGHVTDEDLSANLVKNTVVLSANLKVIMVRDGYRGNGF